MPAKRKRDHYRKLHRRRRRQSNPLPVIGLLLVLVGGALYAHRDALPAPQQSLSIAPTSNAVVAQLTSRDAVYNAVQLAQFSLDEAQPSIAPAPEKVEVKPPRLVKGVAAKLSGALKPSESITVALGRRGVSAAAAAAPIAALQDAVNFRRSKPGDAFEVDVNAEGRVTRLQYSTSPTEVWEARYENASYKRHQVKVATESRVKVVSGKISASLWQAFERAGGNGRLAAAFTDIFAYSIDFATETRKGDKFAVAFESQWLDGKQVGTGKVLAARYMGAAGDHQAFLWNGAYYDETGESVERQFLRSPLASVRITSSYGRRFHPVLGKMKMHAGVDYGAPTGTPVQAVADGRVTWSGWKGANGKLIAVQHAGGYTTYYAHLSKIDSKVKVGTRVKKKQVIGKVGSTGRSTGPHLHFGMKKHGKYINPLEVDFERGTPLNKAERAKFKAATAELKKQLQ